MRTRLTWLGTAVAVALIAVVAVACGDDDDGGATGGSPAAEAALESEVTILTHSSFNVSEGVIKAFENTYKAKVNIVKGGDAGEALNRAILTKDNPVADLFFGVDNTLFGRAREAGVFVPYESPKLKDIDQRYVFDASHLVTPVDYGYVNINYDKQYLKERNLQPPTKLEDLTKPEWKGRLVVENPATSSPGLAFLLSTIGKFGESGSYTWKDYWRQLRANDVLVVDGWEEAYFTAFSHNGGPRPLVVSYATSPGYEWANAKDNPAEPPTGNLLPEGAVFRQIEAVALLKGAKHPNLAKKLIDFMLDEQFQSDVGDKMVVYPVNPKAKLPEFFKFAEAPAKPVDLDPDRIAKNQEAWVREWTQIVLR